MIILAVCKYFIFRGFPDFIPIEVADDPNILLSRGFPQSLHYDSCMKFPAKSSAEKPRKQSARFSSHVSAQISTHIKDLRGASRLAIEATSGVTDLVQAMHEVIASGPMILGRPLQSPTRAICGPLYGSIRGLTRFVGMGLDSALAQLSPFIEPPDSLSDTAPRPAETEFLLAVINGVLGDYLQATTNPLAIQMQFRHAGVPLTLEPQALLETLPAVGQKLLVLVHGSCLNDRRWLRRGHDHGTALARNLGYTPIYLYYNTGLHISSNGRAFDDLLEQLVQAWPAPLSELVIVSHSMGGLVARSACNFGEKENHRWRRKLRALICLGTPHHGAPLERAGNWFQQLLGISPYSAPLARLGKIRSAGVTDMRYGNVLDMHWQGHDRFAHGKDTRCPLPLPEGVDCYAIAATRSVRDVRKLAGDGIVPLESALGWHLRPELTLAFPKPHQWIGYGMKHLDLLSRVEVYERIRSWLETSS